MKKLQAAFCALMICMNIIGTNYVEAAEIEENVDLVTEIDSELEIDSEIEIDSETEIEEGINAETDINEDIDLDTVIEEEVDSATIIEEEMDSETEIKEDIDVDKVVEEEIDSQTVIEENIDLEKIIEEEVDSEIGIDGEIYSEEELLDTEECGTDDPSIEAHGSGSYQLNEERNDYRFYTEYFVKAASGKSITTAGINRRTSINVYAKEGEKILFGSSVNNSQINAANEYTTSVTGVDIVITTPNGERVPENVYAPGDNSEWPRGRGYISNPEQEKNGPVIKSEDSSNDKYYVPIEYEVLETGVYTFDFHSVTGYNDGVSSNLPKPMKAGEAWNQGKSTVAAWDITVVNEEGAQPIVKEGRAWADWLALTTGAAGSTTSDLNLHVLSHDGYVYKVDFNKAVPYGFIFFANNTGFMTSVTDEHNNQTYRPIYHSFYDESNDLANMSTKENIYLHKPYEDDTPTEETYKIFFNRPSSDLDAHGIKTEPADSVELTNLKFNGIGENLAQSGHGGYFSFDSTGEAMVTIRLDLRKAIFDSEGTMDSYSGSGIVEITAPAVVGSNTFYWDGKDTDGVVLPAGIYGNNNVVLSSEVKRGELHFPVIDMEGLYGGLRVERLNGVDNTSESRYDLYYNNNPLVYGTIEGKEHNRVTKSSYDILSDGTNSYKIDDKYGGAKFFKGGQQNISTIVKDTKEYLSEKFFNTSYDQLSLERRAIIDAEFGSEEATYHFEPVDSKNPMATMLFSCDGNSGGGNQSGIDVWTYYTQGVVPSLISFAIMDSTDKGMVQGQVFYDADRNAQYNTGDIMLSNVKVRLIDSNGKAVVHDEMLPCFDDKGYFVYNNDGTVKHELKSVKFETVTDSTGYYRFVGVPYSVAEDTTYYVQVMLNDVQSEVLRYTCTTSKKLMSELKTADDVYFLPGTSVIDETIYGADGNKVVPADYTTKIYGRKYDRDAITNETVFEKEYAQSVTFSLDDTPVENGVRVKEFKKIGYSTAVPLENQKDYKIVKKWGQNSIGYDTHEISDGLIVELWIWNDSAIEEENTLELSRRTGALMDTQVLNKDNDWTYTWEKLDDRLQYYILEYYTKKKADGEIIYNDKGEPRKVLIGGTMPIFSTIPDGHNGQTYGFVTNLGDYPETIPDPDDNTKRRIPIQTFSDGGTHANSITKKEKLESVDNNARQYNVTYTLSTEDAGKTNVIEVTNSQVYDDRTYYVWLDHETVLPDLIGQTYVDNGVRKSHALTLKKDVPIDGTNEYTIKGLSVSSIDAAQTKNIEGNATKAFRIAENGRDALFTATNHGNYKTGTGTRTYQVKYVVDGEKNPVSVKADEAGNLVLASNKNVKVEVDSNYLVYTWYMTIHVYDVESDGVIEYDPSAGEVKLQDALSVGTELKWTLSHDGTNYNSVSYTNNDPREKGILHNDIYRLPLYKSAENPDMGSCADLVGIAYAGSSTVDNVSDLVFEDTYQSKYAAGENEDRGVDGIVIAHGNGGYVKAALNTLRNTRINRTQDHVNYASVSFTPDGQGESGASNAEDDVFYYKIVVFAEDNTYKNYRYEDIDASEGVVMYTHFTMRPKNIPPGEDPDVDPTPTPDVDPTPTPDVDPTPTPDVDPTPTPDVDPTPTPDVDPTPTPDVDPTPTPDVDPTPTPDVEPTPIPNDDYKTIITPVLGDYMLPVFILEEISGETSEETEENTTENGIVVERISTENSANIPVVITNENVKSGTASPKTGDDGHVILWVSLVGLGVVFVVLGVYKKKERW